MTIKMWIATNLRLRKKLQNRGNLFLQNTKKHAFEILIWVVLFCV
ncbi:hypothetical protein [Helicobacter sp. T3_23-1056]